MNNYINKVAESKLVYRSKMAALPFEEKVKIIIALQKIDSEMRKSNSSQNKTGYRQVWQISE